MRIPSTPPGRPEGPSKPSKGEKASAAPAMMETADKIKASVRVPTAGKHTFRRAVANPSEAKDVAGAAKGAFRTLKQMKSQN